MGGRYAEGNRVRIGFEVGSSDGGGLRGQDFRLDIEGEKISDEELARCIVRDMRLLMVGEVRILNKEIIAEGQERGSSHGNGDGRREMIDAGHTVEEGMVTYGGLPAPIICDYLSREESREHYAEGTEVDIGKIGMVANTGTYVDSPFHRYADGKDLSELPLSSLADLEAIVVRRDPSAAGRALDRDAFEGLDVAGKAVLVNTGWDAHWRTDRYFEGYPFLTEGAAELLAGSGAAIVGIDPPNMDDTEDGCRPVHTILLGAEVPIVEHPRGPGGLPDRGVRFSAVPVKVRGFGTFPVRAFVTVDL